MITKLRQVGRGFKENKSRIRKGIGIGLALACLVWVGTSYRNYKPTEIAPKVVEVHIPYAVGQDGKWAPAEMEAEPAKTAEQDLCEKAKKKAESNPKAARIIADAGGDALAQKCAELAGINSDVRKGLRQYVGIPEEIIPLPVRRPDFEAKGKSEAQAKNKAQPQQQKKTAIVPFRY